MPARAPLLDAVVDDVVVVVVGLDDAAMLLAPEPHIPVNPDVASVPEVTHIPDVPHIAPAPHIPHPPIAELPTVPSGEVATVEHAGPLLSLGTVIVPVKPLGTVLTPGDAPSGKPFGPTDSPGTIPNEEVAPSEGVVVPTWAKAGMPHNKDHAA